jgi:tetratricopeptide (TPR) repeat protein
MHGMIDEASSEECCVPSQSTNLVRLFSFALAGFFACVGMANAGQREDGIQLYNQRQLEPALKDFAKALQDNPHDTASCYYMANCCYGLRRYDEAIKLYWYIVRNFPNSREAYSAKAFLKTADREYVAHSTDPALLKLPDIKGAESAAATSASVGASAAPYKLDSSAKQTIIDQIVVVVRAQANRPDVSTGMVKRVKTALSAYPNNLLALVAGRGCKIYLTPTMIDKEPGLQNSTPSGYEEGQTYKNCPGMFKDGNEIVLCELSLSQHDDSEWTTLPDPVGTLRHELGHAVDYYMGQISSTEEYKHIYLLEMARIDDNDKPVIAYFLQKDYRGPCETFAELMCEQYGGRKDDRRGERLAQNFPQLSKLIAKKISEIPSI